MEPKGLEIGDDIKVEESVDVRLVPSTKGVTKMGTPDPVATRDLAEEFKQQAVELLTHAKGLIDDAVKDLSAPNVPIILENAREDIHTAVERLHAREGLLEAAGIQEKLGYGPKER
jgi:hypothetical protein